jgi:predicted acylesterase/phospholipase RssA
LTGRILNITVISETEHSPPKLLNYKTAPNVTIKSAVLASSAVPGILPPIELKQKNEFGDIVGYYEEGRLWRDGSLRIDIPLSSLHQMFQINYSIVSQVNPHVVLFFFDAKGSSGMPSSHRKGRGWRGGFVLSLVEQYLKLDMKKWLLVLRDLQLMPMIHSQDWSHVYLQKFAGSTTLVPSVTWTDYFHLLTDPNEVRMQMYIDGGMRTAWPKVHMIANRMKPEKLIFKYRDMFKEGRNAGN